MTVRPVSSAEGKIRSLALFFEHRSRDTTREELDRWLSDVIPVVAHNLKSATFFVVVDVVPELFRDVSGQIKAFFEAKRIKSKIYSNKEVIREESFIKGRGKPEYTAFIQDHVNVVESGGEVMVLIDNFPKKEHGMYSISEFSFMDFKLQSCDVCIPGGDVLCGRTKHGHSFALVGSAVYAANELSEGEVEKKLAAAYGVGQVVPIKYSSNPDWYWSRIFYHLDLFITLGGAVDDSNYLVTVAQIRREYLYGDYHLDMVEEMEQKLDDVANRLQGLVIGDMKLKVERIPVPILFRDFTIYIPAYYNNCLVENGEEESAIYLPDYLHSFASENGSHKEYISILERAKADLDRIYSAYFSDNIRWLKGGYHELSFDKMAAIHCLIKVLERSDP
jgi:hypothetical protein